MKPKRKYKKSYRIDSMSSLTFLLERGAWVYLRDTPKHPKVMMRMMYGTLQGFVLSGLLFKAVPTEKER